MKRWVFISLLIVVSFALVLPVIAQDRSGGGASTFANDPGGGGGSLCQKLVCYNKQMSIGYVCVCLCNGVLVKIIGAPVC